VITNTENSRECQAASTDRKRWEHSRRKDIKCGGREAGRRNVQEKNQECRKVPNHIIFAEMKVKEVHPDSMSWRKPGNGSTVASLTEVVKKGW